MASRLFALIVWAAVAASLAFWGLRWIARPAGVPTNASPVTLDAGSHGDTHRLLAGPAPAGSAPAADPGAASALAARLRLLGVVAPRSGTEQGVALLSVDGKPPRAVRVGGTVDGEMTLLSLHQRGAQIGPSRGPAVLSLELPPLPPPSTGSLPPPTGVTTTPPPGTAPHMAPAAPPAMGGAPRGTLTPGLLPPPGTSGARLPAAPDAAASGAGMAPPADNT